MKAWRFHGGFLLAITITGLMCAQPEMEARAALSQLVEAGSYSWKETRGFFTDPLRRNARAVPLATGETVIDGYTTAAVQGRKVVLRGSQAVIWLNDHWRATVDLTDDEVEEILRRPKTLEDGVVEQAPHVITTAQANRVRHWAFDPTAPHEVLRVLLQMAKNFRREGAVITADAATTLDGLVDLQQYLETGIRRIPKRSPSVLNVLTRRGSAGADPGPPLRPGERATLIITLNAGAIEEFAVEITGLSSAGPDGEPAQPHPFTRVFTTKLTDIGTTTVDVDPEAQALFLEVARTR